MHIRNVIFKGRQGWELDNGVLQLVMIRGGGHFASLMLKNGPCVNPLWNPVWQGIEPWHYKKSDDRRYSCKMLASITGHNICLGWFGSSSPSEERQGLGAHGEATVARWRMVRKSVSGRTITLVCECDLPASMMRLRRTVRLTKGRACVKVREVIINLARRDLPFTLCEHVTFGPPFLKKGVTQFNMSATQAHTYPGEFDKPPRLKSDTAFTWPMAPGVDGKPVDLRTLDLAKRRNADFSAQLMDPACEQAWFSAVNPELGLTVMYRWNRADFPWVGNWEENYAKQYHPWGGKTLARGMEFTNTPFPDGLRKAVERGKLDGVPTYRWLPAKGRVVVDFEIMMNPQQIPQ
ncbi:MAG: hypothetical protein WCS52_18625 [bacterium]